MSNHASALMLGVSATVALCVSGPALAQSVPQGDLQQQLEEMRAREKAALDRVDALEKRLQSLEAVLGTNAATPLDDDAQSTMRGRGVVPGSAAVTGAASALALQESPPIRTESSTAGLEPDRKAPAPTDAVEAVTRAEQGHFGSRFSLEPGISYSRFSNAQLNLSGFLALDAIFLGLISIDEINSSVFTADVTARYGLNDRLQFDVNVPYLYRRSNFQTGGAGGNAEELAEKTVTESGLGDVSAGASYRVFRETARRPDVVLNARVKAPTGKHPFGVELEEVEGTEGNFQVPTRLSTGTGVWGAAAGVSVLKTIDPMVVFGSLTYFHNFGKKFKDIDENEGDQPGRVKIGDAFQYGLGVAYALNDTSSLSMSFTQRFVKRSKLRLVGEDWQTIVGSQANVGVLNLGATFSLSDRMTLLSNLGVGLTDDAPDMVVSMRLPYRF